MKYLIVQEEKNKFFHTKGAFGRKTFKITAADLETFMLKRWARHLCQTACNFLMHSYYIISRQLIYTSNL